MTIARAASGWLKPSKPKAGRLAEKPAAPLAALWAISLALAAPLLAPAPASSAPASPPGGGGGPISISADRMTADQNSKIVTFSGRVIARQDDLIITCDRMRVHYQPVGAPSAPGSGDAEAIAAMEAGIPPPPPQGEGRAVSVEAPAASPSPGGPAQAPQASAPGDPLGGGQEVHRVDCEGSVRVQQGDKLAVGQKALYLAKSEPRRLILTGEARLWEGANSVTGHQVVYYLDQNRSQVTSRGNRRVRAFYDQGDGSRGERRK